MSPVILVISVLIAFALGLLLERAARRRQIQTAVSAAMAPVDAERAALAERSAAGQTEVQRQAGELAALRQRLDAAVAEAAEAKAEIARRGERELSLQRTIQEQSERLARQQQGLTTEFKNIAGEILKATTLEASAASRQELDLILKPLQQRIQDFQAKVETTYRDESREVISLKEQIKLLLQTSQNVGDKADSLAQALRNNPQQRGRWGEIVLERTLEAAGLTEGRDYITQGTGLGLESEAGTRQKPDVIIQMPEGRCVIVDSKLPLLAYDRLAAAATPEEAARHADDLVRDVKRHVDDLASKEYQSNRQIAALEYVLMFVPLEGALAAALNRGPELFGYGWDRKVALVGPAALMPTLGVIAQLWKSERQNQNARDIARLAGSLCDKLGASIADFNDVAASLDKTLRLHHQAVARLATGQGNVLSLGQRLTKLGATAKKALPPVTVDGVDIAADASSTAELGAALADAAGSAPDQPSTEAPDPEPSGPAPHRRGASA